jgi:hypothetical protein
LIILPKLVSHQDLLVQGLDKVFILDHNELLVWKSLSEIDLSYLLLGCESVKLHLSTLLFEKGELRGELML